MPPPFSKTAGNTVYSSNAVLARMRMPPDNRPVARRIHVEQLQPGQSSIGLNSAQAHHLRDVLRLKTGDQVEAFDNAGHVALATIGRCDADHVVLEISRVESARTDAARIVVASAVPK